MHLVAERNDYALDLLVCMSAKALDNKITGIPGFIFITFSQASYDPWRLLKPHNCVASFVLNNFVSSGNYLSHHVINPP